MTIVGEDDGGGDESRANNGRASLRCSGIGNGEDDCCDGAGEGDWCDGDGDNIVSESDNFGGEDGEVGELWVATSLQAMGDGN